MTIAIGKSSIESNGLFDSMDDWLKSIELMDQAKFLELKIKLEERASIQKNTFEI